MTPEQKQRAAELLTAWRATAYALHADRMADLLQELIAAPADLARDAARYRWLLDSNWYVGPDSFYCTGGGELEDYQNKNNSAESLDAAVDAAIAAKKGGAK